jgi:hypothetical protein
VTSDRLTDEQVYEVTQIVNYGDDVLLASFVGLLQALAREVQESRAEIERLRAENGALSAGVARNGTRWEAERALADRLAEALRYPVYLLTDEKVDAEVHVAMWRMIHDVLDAWKEARRDQ